MKKSLMFLLLVFFVYSCSEEGPSIPTNNNNTGNSPPAEPSNPYPPDGGQNISRIVTLSWVCSDPDPEDSLSFDIYMNHNNPPDYLYVQNHPYNSYSVGLVAGDTTFFWRVVAKDNHGGVRSGDVWSFRTSSR